MNYYISDLHIGHTNILKLSHRPFDTMDEMIEKIIKNWNKTVKTEDDVYILGIKISRQNEIAISYFC